MLSNRFTNITLDFYHYISNFICKQHCTYEHFPCNYSWLALSLLFSCSCIQFNGANNKERQRSFAVSVVQIRTCARIPSARGVNIFFSVGACVCFTACSFYCVLLQCPKKTRLFSFVMAQIPEVRPPAVQPPRWIQGSYLLLLARFRPPPISW